MSWDVTLKRTMYLSYDKGATYVEQDEELYTSNITHNLNAMADAAGIYEALWRPEEINCVYAKDIIPILTDGLSKLKSDPKKYKEFNSPNGWGMYENFVPFIEKYLIACNKYPESIIEISR